MGMKPIDHMYETFGKADGKCKDCYNLVKHQANRTWYKCRVWGESSCETSDWRLKYQSCGMYGKKYNGIPLKEIIKHQSRPKVVEQIEGQIRIREWIKTL